MGFLHWRLGYGFKFHFHISIANWGYWFHTDIYHRSSEAVFQHGTGSLSEVSHTVIPARGYDYECDAETELRYTMPAGHLDSCGQQGWPASTPSMTCLACIGPERYRRPYNWVVLANCLVKHSIELRLKFAHPGCVLCIEILFPLALM